MKNAKKYGYEYLFDQENDGCLIFRNPNIREELDTFAVSVDEELERVSMTILIYLGSWNDATECDLNDLEDIKKNINLWLSEESLKKVEEYFLESEE